MKNLFHNALVIANSFPGPRQPLSEEQKKAIFAKLSRGGGGGRPPSSPSVPRTPPPQGGVRTGAYYARDGLHTEDGRVIPLTPDGPIYRKQPMPANDPIVTIQQRRETPAGSQLQKFEAAIRDMLAADKPLDRTVIRDLRDRIVRTQPYVTLIKSDQKKDKPSPFPALPDRGMRPLRAMP